jgi:hypothetical protein
MSLHRGHGELFMLKHVPSELSADPAQDMNHGIITTRPELVNPT